MYKTWCVYNFSLLSDSEILTPQFIRVKNPLVCSLSIPDSWTVSFRVDYQCTMLHLVSLHKALWKSAVRNVQCSDLRARQQDNLEFHPRLLFCHLGELQKYNFIKLQVPQLRTFLPSSLFHGDKQCCTFFPLNFAIAPPQPTCAWFPLLLCFGDRKPSFPFPRWMPWPVAFACSVEGLSLSCWTMQVTELERENRWAILTLNPRGTSAERWKSRSQLLLS